jgi:hypothetical protein
VTSILANRENRLMADSPPRLLRIGSRRKRSSRALKSISGIELLHLLKVTGGVPTAGEGLAYHDDLIEGLQRREVGKNLPQPRPIHRTQPDDFPWLSHRTMAQVICDQQRNREKQRRRENTPMPPRTKAGKAAKVKTVLGEFKRGTLHSGSPSGPKVTNRKQAQAIALSEAGQAKPKRKK